jgi:hypothetical protein
MVGGLVLGLAVIVAGIALSKKENPGPLDPRLGIADSAATRQLGLRQQVDHPVNESQQKAANSLDSEKAPFFSLKGTDGRTHTLAELNREKPLLIFFVEKECPCCLGAKYFVDKMADDPYRTRGNDRQGLLWLRQGNAPGSRKANRSTRKAPGKEIHPRSCAGYDDLWLHLP